MILTGTIRYFEISMGFWAFEANDGSKWELFELPDEFKKDGLVCNVELIIIDGDTINMWGRPAKVKAVTIKKSQV